MNHYQVSKFAEQCLHSNSIPSKLEITAKAFKLWQKGRLTCEFDSPPKPISATCFPERPRLVEPRQVPPRSVADEDGRIALLHAVAHIEFYAIHLAWDIIYRFQNMPRNFYGDWLGVACEEAQHFVLVTGRLRQLGCDYGLLAAHRGLWEVAEDTADDVLARLALVPRYMEARGLDVTPGMIEKLQSAGDQPSAEILTTILNEEIGHVRIGSEWFKTVCETRKLEPEKTYFELLDRFLRGKIRGPVNRKLRIKAGFNEAEVQRLESLVQNR